LQIFHAQVASVYSLIRPPGTGFRRIRSLSTSIMVARGASRSSLGGSRTSSSCSATAGLPAWHAFRDVVERLADNSLIDDDAASRFLAGHPDRGLP
jgi:hypothetical protein